MDWKILYRNSRNTVLGQSEPWMTQQMLAHGTPLLCPWFSCGSDSHPRKATAAVLWGFFDMFQHLPVSLRQGFSSYIGFPASHEHNLGWAPSSRYNMNNNITALHSAECAVNLNWHICSPVSLLYCHGTWTEVFPLVEGRWKKSLEKNHKHVLYFKI